MRYITTVDEQGVVVSQVPTEELCKECGDVIYDVYPGMSVDAVKEKRDESPAFVKESDTIKQRLKERMMKLLLEQSVYSNNSRKLEAYMKVCFVLDQHYSTKFTEPEKLKCKVVEIPHPTRHQMLKGVLVHPDQMPKNIPHIKVKLSGELMLCMSEMILNTNDLLRAGQANAMYQHQVMTAGTESYGFSDPLNSIQSTPTWAEHQKKHKAYETELEMKNKDLPNGGEVNRTQVTVTGGREALLAAESDIAKTAGQVQRKKKIGNRTWTPSKVFGGSMGIPKAKDRFSAKASTVAPSILSGGKSVTGSVGVVFDAVSSVADAACSFVSEGERHGESVGDPPSGDEDRGEPDSLSEEYPDYAAALTCSLGRELKGAKSRVDGMPAGADKDFSMLAFQTVEACQRNLPGKMATRNASQLKSDFKLISAQMAQAKQSMPAEVLVEYTTAIVIDIASEDSPTSVTDWAAACWCWDDETHAPKELEWKSDSPNYRLCMPEDIVVLKRIKFKSWWWKGVFNSTFMSAYNDSLEGGEGPAALLRMTKAFLQEAAFRTHPKGSGAAELLGVKENGLPCWCLNVLKLMRGFVVLCSPIPRLFDGQLSDVSYLIPGPGKSSTLPTDLGKTGVVFDHKACQDFVLLIDYLA